MGGEMKGMIGLMVAGLVIIVIGLSLSGTILGSAGTSGAGTLGCYNEVKKFEGTVKSAPSTELPTGSQACYATAALANTGSGAVGTADPVGVNFSGTKAMNDLIPLLYYVVIVTIGVGLIAAGGYGGYKKYNG